MDRDASRKPSTTMTARVFVAIARCRLKETPADAFHRIEAELDWPEMAGSNK
jgi:hypothetical protein